MITSCRLDNITKFLNTVATYETLSLSRIEGIETFNARFGLLASTLKKKPYNPLEHRKPDFDMDYQEFKHQMADLEVRNEPHVMDITRVNYQCTTFHSRLKFNPLWTLSSTMLRLFQEQLSSPNVLRDYSCPVSTCLINGSSASLSL